MHAYAQPAVLRVCSTRRLSRIFVSTGHSNYILIYHAGNPMGYLLSLHGQLSWTQKPDMM